MAIISKLLNRLFPGGPVYIRISRERIKVRDTRGGGYYDDEPLIGISADDPPIVLAVGAAARSSSSHWVNPFDHPRVLIGDFVVAEKLIQHALKEVYGGAYFRSSPVVIIHVTEDLEGGLSQIERRELQEMVAGAGARESHIWEGRELTDEELRSGAYLSAT